MQNKTERTSKHDRVRLAEKILPVLIRSLGCCNLCVRKCGVNRLKGEKGYCSSGANPIVYSYAPHYGEEPCLSGNRGSGTIFFTRCNMRCVYCQNYKFSQFDAGKEISSKDLALIMLELQEKGCHNINLVSPTHFSAVIVEALMYAYSGGLKLPIVYNTGGYDSLHVIKLLGGLIDIYLPDMRYSSDVMAERYSDAPGYVANNRSLVKEMHRQTGDLKIFKGIARKGLIIRLLVLPHGISGTEETLEFISREIGHENYLSVMSQYYPAYQAKSYEELSGRITYKEYKSVIDKMNELGFRNGWVQPFEAEFDRRFAGENFSPNF